MVGLLDLPEHILTQSLSYLDIKSLQAAGATCRGLHAVTNDDEVWRRLFLNKYDDPRAAGAFPTPRTAIEWRKSVIDRESALGFLKSYHFDKKKVNDEVLATFMAWAPRVFPPVLDLFLDLPPPGQPSANMTILVSLIQGRLLSLLCHAFNTDETNHFESLFNRLPSFWSKDNHHYQRSLGRKYVSRLHIAERSDRYNFGPVSDFNCEGGNKLWIYTSAATMLFRPPPDTSQGDEAKLRASIEALRGEPLSVLTSEAAEREQGPDTWDWAGVGGSWHVEQVRWYRIVREVDSWSWNTDLSLQAVKSREAVESVCPVSERGTDIWADFPNIPSSFHGLPPIYFHGMCTVDYYRSLVPGDPFDYGTPGPGPAFVHGVVYLASDPSNAPQVKYVLVLTGLDAGNEWRRMLFDGVEPWGPRSGAGVFGSYWRAGDPEQELPTGYIWLQRL